MLFVHMLKKKKKEECFVQIFLLVVIGVIQFYIVLFGGFYIHVF